MSTVETKKFHGDDKYREEVRKIKINDREFTFDPRDKIFGLQEANDKLK
jgi:hypothetical protein